MPSTAKGFCEREDCRAANASCTWLDKLSSQGRRMLISMPNYDGVPDFCVGRRHNALF